MARDQLADSSLMSKFFLSDRLNCHLVSSPHFSISNKKHSANKRCDYVANSLHQIYFCARCVFSKL